MPGIELNIIAGYIDYKMIGEPEMHHQDWKKVQEEITEKFQSDGYTTQLLFLVTCLRFEVFMETSNPEASRILQDYNLKILDSNADIFLRVTRIATGLESTIIGEVAIMDQIKQAMKTSSISPDQRLWFLMNSAVDSASIVRQKHDFYSPHSYGTIATKLLLQKTDVEVRGLGIIGAGSMVKDFLSTLSTDHRKFCLPNSIYLVNRTVTKARKMVRQYKLDVSVQRLDQVDEVVKNTTHIFIATGGIIFTENLFALLDNNRVVDICFPVLVKNTEKHITSFHPLFCNEIEVCNKQLLGMKNRVLDEVTYIASEFSNSGFC